MILPPTQTQQKNNWDCIIEVPFSLPNLLWVQSDVVSKQIKNFTLGSIRSVPGDSFWSKEPLTNCISLGLSKFKMKEKHCFLLYIAAFRRSIILISIC